MKAKRLLTMVLATILVVSACVFVVPQSGMKVQAAGTGKDIQLGATVLNDNVNTASAPVVYYDSNKDSWKVVGYAGTGVASASGTITLIAPGNMANGSYDSVTRLSNNYSGSNLQTMINSIAGRLTTGENGAVALKTLTGGNPNYNESGHNENDISGATVSNATMWPLSVAEANQLNADLRALDTANTSWALYYWWLRSPGNNGSHAAVVRGVGIVSKIGYRVDTIDEYGARPAFNLNLSSIIFTSAATGGKSSGAIGAGALTAVGDMGSNTEWKFTVYDSARSGFTASRTNPDTLTAGGTAEITYNGAQTGTGEYVSAIITDSNNTILYYGNIASCNSASGTASINIPATVPAGFSLYVFQEKCNGDKMTDYSSGLVNLTALGSSGSGATVISTSSQSMDSPEEEVIDDTPETTYLDELTVSLEEAIKAGGPQTIYWSEGTALPGPVMKLLEENPQITLVFSYTYEGLDYVVTIPGKNVKYDPNVPWCGPLYLYGLYGKYSASTPITTTATTSGSRTYTIISGETLWGIANRLGTTVDELVRLNNITDPDRINIGQIIRY